MKREWIWRKKLFNPWLRHLLIEVGSKVEVRAINVDTQTYNTIYRGHNPDAKLIDDLLNSLKGIEL